MAKELPKADFLYHTVCNDCGSSDGCAVYSDGSTYCFVCNKYHRGSDSGSVPSAVPNSDSHTTRPRGKQMIDLDSLIISPLRKRMIPRETCNKFKYYTGTYKDKPCQVACYYNMAGELKGQKIRFPDKTFCVLGTISNILYGANLWGAGGRKIIITEGEIDALTVSSLQQDKYPVVSIPNGAQGAKKVIEANLEYLSTFDEIILMFDMDKPGRDACLECAKVLPLGKAFIATLPYKDPNECLQNGKGNEVINAIWNAQPYRPDGIVSGQDLYEECVEKVDDLADSVPYPWDALQSKTRGMRHGELYVLTSGSGMGKSTLMRELEYYFGVTLGEKCGIVALEESTKKTGLELMSIHLNTRILLNPDEVTEDQRKEAFSQTIGNGNFFLYDHFGSLNGGNLLSKLRYMIVALGCKRIFLDHISIVVSGMDNDEDGGERKAIDKLMTNLRSLVEETGCTMFVISHLKRPEKKGHEEGGQVSLSQLRGSGAIAQLSDMVIGLERNQQGDTPNVVTIRVLKNRFSGDTGVGGYLYYDDVKGRLSDFDKELSEEFEEVQDDCPF